MKREDPEFVPPTSVHAQDTVARLGNGALANGEKRGREDRMDEDERQPKREKTDDDDEGEEMEIEDDEEVGAKGKNGGTQRGLGITYMALTSRSNAILQASYLQWSTSHQLACCVQIFHRR